MIKQNIWSNKYILLSAIVLFIYSSPNIFFPKEARFLIYDNLNSNVVWYKKLAESGKFFWSNYKEVNVLGVIGLGSVSENVHGKR